MHHKDDGSFRNPWPSYKEYGILDFFTKALPESKRLTTYTLPTLPVDWDRIKQPTETQALWIGHATFLLQSQGYNILTDPVFSKRCSPFQFMGPLRYSDPACAVSDLPPIHVVLISHNHYDHIDSGSIRALVDKETRDLQAAAAGGKRFPGSRPYAGTLFVCPLRVSKLLQSLGVIKDKIVELDWWDTYHPLHTAVSVGDADALSPLAQTGRHTVAWPANYVDPDTSATLEGEAVPAEAGGSNAEPSRLPPIEIACVPAQHQSARTPFDRNQTLWCGYVVTIASPEGPQKVYFSGDTGYRAVPKGAKPFSPEEEASPSCPAFRQVGERYGPIDLALLPLGAYSPRWFMSSFHASPEDSVEMHRDIRSKRSIGMHWATFPLTDEPIEEPAQRLIEARRRKGVADDEFVAVWPGALVGAESGVDRSQLARPLGKMI